MKKQSGTFPGASGLCDIHFYVWSPEKPKALVILSHGMCEYVKRYEEIAKMFCENDIAFCGADHLGHGASVPADDMLGYFGHSRGYINMVRDLYRMTRIAKKKFPDIPRFLLAHSMGSFLGRILISKYETGLSGAIFTGTAGGFTGRAPLRAFLDLTARTNGELYRHKFCTKIAFGAFNMRISNHRTPNDWLSRDDKSVDKFNADPKCNFTFTTAGYRDMLNALLCCNSAPVIENTPRSLPMLFLSGGMDPIGEYGKGVRAAVKKYRDAGCRASLRVYREARHELLFELNRNEVVGDIIKFITKLS